MYPVRTPPALLAAVLLVVVSSASGTPPDVMTSNLVMLGASDSVVVFLAETGFNHGSHYLWEVRWFLLAMDLSDFSFQWQEMGSVMYADDDFGGTQYSPDAEMMTIPGFLELWDCRDPLDFRGQSWREPLDELDWFISDSSLFVSCDRDTIIFTGARFFDPLRLAAIGTDQEGYFIPDGGSAVREVDDLESLPCFFDFSTGRMDLTFIAGATLHGTRVFITGIPDEAVPFEVILTIPADEYQSAMDSLVPRR